jgi:hypothetical protein
VPGSPARFAATGCKARLSAAFPRSPKEVIKKAMERFDKARSDYYAQIKLSFPVGSVVYYDHGSHEREGMVARHTYFENIIIHSKAKKEISIDASRIKDVRK